MAKTYLADKDTLDTVNNKVGASTEVESSTPTTLFSGLKYIIQGVIDLKKLLSDGKTAVANAITGKGVTTATNAAFATMAANIAKISTLVTDTADATATAAQILSGKTAYVKGAKVTGTIKSKAAATYTPGTTDQTIAAGQYLSGAQTIKGSANLKAENIKQGVDIMGVMGSCVEGSVLKSYTATFTGEGVSDRTAHSLPSNVMFGIQSVYLNDKLYSIKTGTDGASINYSGKHTVSIYFYSNRIEVSTTVGDAYSFKLTINYMG